MESRPQNPEFKNNPENFHPCIRGLNSRYKWVSSQQKGLTSLTFFF